MSNHDDRIFSQNVAYVERLLETFARDPAQVPAQWRDYLQGLDGGSNGHTRFGPSFKPASVFNPPPLVSAARRLGSAEWQDRVSQLIRAYRLSRGHLASRSILLGKDRRRRRSCRWDFMA